ncbi:MAG: hypothetical protein ACLFTI_06085, partial [Anaerolineales bacterium]
AVYQIDPGVARAAQKIVIAAEAGRPFARVHLTLDGEPLASFDRPPYSALWQLAPGEHTFTAIGVDAMGERVTSEAVRITVRP